LWSARRISTPKKRGSGVSRNRPWLKKKTRRLEKENTVFPFANPN
jgi:hypothetical protein